MHENDGMLPRNVCNQRAQQRGKRSLTERSQSQTRERNAHLHSGDDAIEVPEQIEHNPRARIARLHQLPDARKPHGDKGELHGREKSVHGHQRE